MFEQPIHLSNHAGGLEPSAFQAQLRRLESLQTLMSQGSAVVSEVAQFMIKVREELGAFEREQLSCAAAQQGLMNEKAELLLRMQELEKSCVEANLQVQEREHRLVALQADLEAERVALAAAHRSAGERDEAEEKVAGAARHAEQLEHELARQKAIVAMASSKAREEAAASFAGEIAALTARMAAMERQLETERERRGRLMEVVKAQQIVVTPAREREIAQ